MRREPKIGDKVRVLRSPKKAYQKVIDQIGYITDIKKYSPAGTETIIYTCRIKFDDNRNDKTEDGCYIFSANCLQLVESSVAIDTADLFPTFEQIDAGYCCLRRQGKYLGIDQYGAPKWAKSTYVDIVINHQEYKEIITNIYYRATKKGKVMYFGFELAGNKYSYHFEYSKEGWQQCKDKIVSILQWYNKCINKILGIANVDDTRYIFDSKNEIVTVKVASIHNICGKLEYDVIAKDRVIRVNAKDLYTFSKAQHHKELVNYGKSVVAKYR